MQLAPNSLTSSLNGHLINYKIKGIAKIEFLTLQRGTLKKSLSKPRILWTPIILEGNMTFFISSYYSNNKRTFRVSPSRTTVLNLLFGGCFLFTFIRVKHTRVDRHVAPCNGPRIMRFECGKPRHTNS